MKFDARKFLSGLIISSVFSNVCDASHLNKDILQLIRECVFDALHMQLFDYCLDGERIPDDPHEVYRKISAEICCVGFKDDVISRIKNYGSDMKQQAIKILKNRIIYPTNSKPEEKIKVSDLCKYDGDDLIEKIIFEYATLVCETRNWCCSDEK